MKKLVCTAVIMCWINSGFAGDPEVQGIPEDQVEKVYVLEVMFIEKRDGYMNSSASITKISGFKDRKTCWDHAAAISKAIRDAATSAQNKAGENVGCREAIDFRKPRK